MPPVVSVVPKGSIRKLLASIRRKQGILEPTTGGYALDGRAEARQQIAGLGAFGVDEGRQQLQDIMARGSRR